MHRRDRVRDLVCEHDAVTAPAAATSSRILSLLRPALAVALMLAVMWILEIVDVPLGGELDQYGIRPRRIGGLDGVLFAPFLHSGFGHLIANTVPFAVLGVIVALGSARHFAQVTLITGLVAGLGTWLTGRSNSIHLGASSLVFGYLLYLMTRGIFARRVTYILGGVVVAVAYGGILWGLLPRQGISWQGHLFGAIGGVSAASSIHERRDERRDERPPRA
jgi:membrane associated rhomboid family serine protease